MSARDLPLEIPQRIMLLGSGELGRELTICFKRLGCDVIACDNYALAPAMQVTDQSVVLEMTDEKALRAAIEQLGPDLIVPEVEKLAAPVLQWAASEKKIRVAPSAHIVGLTFDRQGIRTLAAEKAGVPTSKYAFAASLEEMIEGAIKVGFPCYVKPTMSSSGHGQSKVGGAQELPGAWEEAAAGARAETGRVIVEGEVKFDYEITLLTVRHLVDGQVQTSFCAPIGHRQENGDYVESWQPQQMSEKTLARAQEVARAVTDALAADTPTDQGPVLGLFGVELFVAGDDVYFSELSPRPHDTGLVTLATQVHSEFELHARAVLGLPLDTTLVGPGASAPFKAPHATKDPRFGGLVPALSVPRTQVRIFGKPAAHPGRRLAVAVAGADTVEEARAAARQARDCLQLQ